MQRIERKVDGLTEEVHDIKQILVGNELIKNDSGLIGKIMDQEKRLSILERWKDRLFFGAIVAAGFGGWGITDLLIKLFAKK